MKRNITLISLLILCVQLSLAQTGFVKVDEDKNTWIDKSAVIGNKLYTFSPYSTIGYREAMFDMSYWNGLFWTDLPGLPTSNVFYGNGNNLVLGSYQNKPVLAGSFFAQNGDIKGVALWNGNFWEGLGGGIHTSRLIHDEFSVEAVQEFEGDLFVCGDFNLADEVPVKNFVKFSNGGWQDIPSGDGLITSLTVSNETLYVSGDFTEIDAVACNNLIAHKNGVWTAVNHSFSSDILKLTTYEDSLVVCTENGFYQKNQDNWDALGGGVKIQELYSITVQNGALYATGLFSYNGIDSIRLIGITATESIAFLLDKEVKSRVTNKLLLQQYQNNLYVMGSFNSLKTQSLKNIARLSPGSSILRGKIFIDKNTNCVFDQGDEPRKNVILSVNDGAYYTSTDSKGEYAFFIENNATTSIEIFTANNETPSCNGAQRTVRTMNNDSILEEHFALEYNEKLTPIKVSIAGENGFTVKHGYDAHYTLNCSAIDPSKFPIKLSLAHDERMQLKHASLQPSSSGSKSIQWEIKRPENIDLTFEMPPKAILMDDVLDFQAYAKSTTKQSEASHSLSQVVISAFDPNDKQCDKEEIEVTDDLLEYHIRFQNLGSDNARNIHIVDTIDNSMPMEYIQILTNSHYEKYATSYKVRDHAIVWSFKDIELPPKALAGEEASSGFITYECGLAEDLKVGTTIENTAYIYFDFQPPVITNTTKTVVIEQKNVASKLEDDFVIYPNPSSSTFTVDARYHRMDELQLYTLDGKVVNTINTVSNDRRRSVDVSHLPTGMYFLRIQYALGVKTYPVIVR